MPPWTLTQDDREFIVREVEPFFPDQTFDAHAHLFSHEHFAHLPAGYRDMPPCLNLACYNDYIDWIHPNGRTKGGLFFGLAFTGDREANNRFVAKEVNNSPSKNDFSQMVISPDLAPEDVYDRVTKGGFVGLKCYHTMATGCEETWQAPIEAYLPEPQVQVADE